MARFSKTKRKIAVIDPMNYPDTIREEIREVLSGIHEAMTALVDELEGKLDDLK